MINKEVFIRTAMVILLASTLAACSTRSPLVTFSSEKPLTALEHSQRTAYLSFYSKWQGVPYRLGGASYNGIDCSAFVQLAFRHTTNVSLPRTTALQAKKGFAVDYDDVTVGDLFFFKTSRTTRHVGIYLGGKQFMHASTSKGVVISRIDNPYWANAFWQIRRVTPRP